MLFHAGAILRLGELGLLRRVQRVSSVSGGSITAALLGLKWKRLRFGSHDTPDNLIPEVIDPLRSLASRTIDLPAMLLGGLLVGSIAERVAGFYRTYLFGDATLQDLPADTNGPRFVINATNVQTGALWRFSRPYMADYRIGRVDAPTVPLAVAVAASSAFPPFLSPLTLRLPEALRDMPGTDLHRPPFTKRAVLTDGGVYDNLGLETAWKRYRTVLVSDGGEALDSEDASRTNWPWHTYRVIGMIYSQVRSLRSRQLVHSYRLPPTDRDHRDGTYWGIRSDVREYGIKDALDTPLEWSRSLALTPTRLKAMPSDLQMRIINWGYAVSDAALRAHVLPLAPAPRTWPYSAMAP